MCLQKIFGATNDLQMLKNCIFSLCLVILSLTSNAQAVRINEVMSSNAGALTDKSGDSPDWIELYNPGPNPVQLTGCGFSDKKGEPYKWIFPDVLMNPDSYLLVFASGKDIRNPLLYWNTVVAVDDTMNYLVPSSEPAGNWRLPDFNDSSWSRGQSGFGFGDGDDSTILPVNSVSVFLRKEFYIDDPATIDEIVLHMDYDDGFVAYVNGVEIARAFMDNTGSFPGYKTVASGNHEALMYQGLQPEKFVFRNSEGLLRKGKNVLAIQVHNSSDTSSDMSAMAFLSLGSFYPFIDPKIVDQLQLDNNELHTNFKIDADGESVYITSANGELMDSVAVVPLAINNSYGRTIADPSVWGIYTTSTPGKANDGSVFSSDDVGVPVFSSPGGRYSTSLKISLSAPTPGDSVYYTVDGSEPTRTSTLAKGEINLINSKVVKARILKSGMIPGRVVTNSYILYNSHDLPVVSLSLNPDDLWDYNNGIYVLGPNAETGNPNFGANFWQDWEKPCHIEFFEPDGSRPVDLDAGVKIFGNWSRANAQKSLAIHFRKDYGEDKVKYKFFEDRPFDEFKALVLRNSGNDWNNTMFRDGLMCTVSIGMNFDQMAYRPAVIFLNGQYWGIQNIREKINEHFIASNHPEVDPDSINMLENDGQVILGSSDDWWSLYNFVEGASLALQGNYQKVEAQLDIWSFIDYYSTQIFYANWDWPGNNLRYWKTTDPDSRWRYIMYDTDFGLGIWNNRSPNSNSLAEATATDGPGWPNPPWSTLMLRKLLENNGFRKQFVNRFADLMNSTLLPANINKILDRMQNSISKEMSYHLNRWSAGSISNWNSNVLSMRTFVNLRTPYVFQHIQQKFGFQASQKITVTAEASQGNIQLNSLKLKSFPWSGSYFQEVPISLTAIPNAGFRFVRWEGITSGTNSVTITVSPKAKMEIRAIFESDGTHYEDVVINEISFNNDAEPDPGDWIEIYNKGNEDIDVSGWKITDSDPTHLFVFPSNTWLRANDYLVVSNDPGKISDVFGSVKNLVGTFDFGLGNATDAVRLFSDQDVLIDEVNYSNVTPWSPFDLTSLSSLELVNPQWDNDLGSNWERSGSYGTPGFRNSIYTGTEEVITQTSGNLQTQNYPNPFSGGTFIEFNLRESVPYRFSIVDMNGRLVRELNDGDDFSTQHTLYWDGNDQTGKSLPAGVYFYKVDSENSSQTGRMIKM